MIALVAISDSSGPPPAAPLRMVSAGSLCALCVPADERDVTVDMLVDREELLEALMEDRDVLPVQFGTALPDERAVARVLQERRDELAAALDRVRGAVEVGLRAQRVEPAGGERDVHSSGHAYLRARIGDAGAARRLHERLGSIARSAVVRSSPDLLRAAYLVDRAAVPDFVAEVQRTQESSPELALLCTGPWPPFSFAGAGSTS